MFEQLSSFLDNQVAASQSLSNVFHNILRYVLHMFHSMPVNLHNLEVTAGLVHLPCISEFNLAQECLQPDDPLWSPKLHI